VPYALIASFLVLSGASSLIYEIIWVRLLSLNIGSDNLSISIVLSCFFLGIALGSYFSARVKASQKSLIHVYIILELSIGISALILFPLFIHLDSLIHQFPFFSTSVIGKFIVTALLLLIPTTAIGATFPIAVRLILQTNKTLGLRIGQLYFYNTFGAVLGSILAGFVLVPSLGLDGANYFAIFLNLFIVIIAWHYRKAFTTILENKTGFQNSPDKPNSENSNTSKIALLSLALSGFILLSCEVAWGKYFAILTGATFQSFSVILAVTLFGIASGSWFIRHRIHKIKAPIQAIALSYLLTAILVMLLREGFTFLPALMTAIDSTELGLQTRQIYRYSLLAIFVFPITFMLGVIFPIAISLFSQDYAQINNKIAKGYSVNTLAGVIGSLATGFYFLPYFGTDSLFFLIIILLLIPPFIVLFTAKAYTIKTKRTVFFLLPSIIVFSILSDGLLYKDLISAVNYRYQGEDLVSKKPEFLFLKEGKSAVISIVKSDENYAIIQKNGLPESMIPLNDQSPTLIFETLQAYIPYLLHPNPQSAYVVGYGGGNTTQAFTDTNIQSIDVSEIEGIVVDAVKNIHRSAATSLKDDRVKIRVVDARTALISSEKKYDIITSQPSHPWLAGSSNLFTTEFFEIVNSRLNKNGIFTQWIALFGMDEASFKIVLKTFYSVFPYGFTVEHKSSGDFMLIGSRDPIIFDFDKMNKRLQSPKIKNNFKAYNVYQPQDLFYLFALTRDEIMESTKDVTLNTDLNLKLELQTSKNYYQELNEDAPYKYVRDTSQLNFLPYFKAENGLETLYELGLRYLKWNLPDKSQRIVKQLVKAKSEFAKDLQFEIFYWLHDFDRATALYNIKQDWPDLIHSHQLDISIQNNDWQNANIIYARIQSKALKKTSYAMMLYKSVNWDTLVDIKSESDEEELWVLMAKIRKGDVQQLRKLNSMIKINYQYLPQISVLTDIYRRLNSPVVAKWYLTNINFLIRDRLLFYQSLTKKARLINNISWVKNLEKLSIKLKKMGKIYSH